MALNGADFSGSARYMYVPAPVVTALVPSSGMLKGGTTVRVVGSNLDAVTSSDKVMCKFGPVSVPAQVESSSSLLCETPGELFSSVRTVSSRCATTLSSSKPHHLTTSYLHHLTASPPQAPRPTLNLSPRSHYTLLQDGVRAHLFPFPKTHTNTRRTRRAAAAAARTPTHTHPPTNPLTHQPAHSHPSSPSPHPHPTPIHQLRTRVANNAFKRRRA